MEIIISTFKEFSINFPNINIGDISASVNNKSFELKIDADEDKLVELLHFLDFKLIDKTSKIFSYTSNEVPNFWISLNSNKFDEFMDKFNNYQEEENKDFTKMIDQDVEYRLRLNLDLECSGETIKFINIDNKELYIEINPFINTFSILTTVNQNDLDNLYNHNFHSIPLSSNEENFFFHTESLGEIIIDNRMYLEDSPYMLLAAGEDSLMHPYYFRPFSYKTLKTKISDIDKIINDTFYPQEDSHWFSLEENLKYEFVGIPENNMQELSACILQAINELSERFSTNEEISEYQEMYTNSILTATLVAASRLSRASLIKAGYDTDIEISLKEKDINMFMIGHLHNREVLEYIAQERLIRIFSLDSLEAVYTENKILSLIIETFSEVDNIDQEFLSRLLLHAITLFDLGVLYQMARTAPELLEPLEEDFIED